MLVPVKWLSEYVNIDSVKIKTLEEKLIMSGSNTEAVHETIKGIENVVVGKILTLKQHPDADKLKVLEIDVEDEVLQIVTNATNVYEGAYLPVFKIGGVLSDGTKIKKGKLRGVESFGMLCSYQELGFEGNVIPKAFSEGVWILDQAYPLGTPIGEIEQLKDYVIEFEITPNRSDCLSILGMARETAATLNIDMKYPDETINNTEGNIHDFMKVSLEAEDLCSRYTGRVVTDVQIKPSPLWMQLRLMKAGMKPKNNIVDITNYVLLEYGQPVHAFDLNTLENNEIVVRKAKKGEVIETLDKVKRTLTEDMLVIADGKKPVALAGIMGGVDTEVSSKTNTLFVEIATFDKKNIRKTSKALQLRSEASSRYEKGVAQGLVGHAADRVCHLIESLGAGKIVGGSIDIISEKAESQPVLVRSNRVNALLGLELTCDQIKDFMERLEIEVEFKGEDLLCTPPYQRLDLLQEADFIEEVARLYGYDRLPSTLFRGNEWGAYTNGQQIELDARQTLVSAGLNEITTYSFISPKSFDQISLSDHSVLRNALTILNPLGEEYSVMRTTLVSNLLEVLARNFKRSVSSAKAFEIGNVFFPKSDALLPVEKKSMAFGMYGEEEDFYSIKGVLDHLMETFGIKAYSYEAEPNHGTYHPGRCANIIYGDGHVLGTIGEVHPLVLKNYSIDVPVMICDLDFNMFMQICRRDKKFKGVPKYPSSTRDLAVLVKEETNHQEIVNIIHENGGKYLESCQLFDVYQGPQIEDGYKSMAYALSFRAEDRTLVEEDVNKGMTKILAKLEEILEAKLR